MCSFPDVHYLQYHNHWLKMGVIWVGEVLGYSVCGNLDLPFYRFRER